MTHDKTFVIAIDGPAASGKGTLARKLAAHFDYALLDTGALYRAVGLNVARHGGDPEKEADAVAAARALGDMDLSDPAIRGESTGALASKVAAIPAVRDILLAFQRDFAESPPGGKTGAILDGRDIGTVVCPDADVKIYIIADVETRAKRRFLEQYGPNGTEAQYEAILADLVQRDARDMNRSTAPLKPAKNAHLLDTTNSDIEAVFEAALGLISKEQANV
ncbi:(d)CMP kinase [Paremcibacter congregatus]|uniref:(d)CMP kinase n=1 Tax=Paremcibacter congregatus TaxID=2043170 RepID=UPI0030EB124B|tara:strand:+ start:1019 stop:1681 length:663 start_codon:yes stop_codon:yes gene_type:complete